MEENLYTLQDMSKQFGWSTAWIRKLEALGLFGELDAPRGRRGRQKKLYTGRDLLQIMWIATLRHAGVELDELRAYKGFADDLIGWLEQYSINGPVEGGEKLQPVFIHQPYKRYEFYIDWSLVSVVDLVQIAKTSEWLQLEAKRIRERIELWLIQNEMIASTMRDLRDSTTRSGDSMGLLTQGAVRIRLLKRP
jgi:hypothetical protein